jgi:tripartite-type tricarboxylate transporter receptor subunit TctC
LAVLALASCAAAAAPAVTYAQDGAPYPTRIVRIIVPFGPGSTTDLMARAVGQKLSDRWKQTVIVENRAGAGGNIGAEVVARAPADGYTLLVGAASTIINPSLYKKLRFDALKDLTPVINIASVTNVLVVNPDVPAKDVKELIALAQKKQMSFGSGGMGGTIHLSGELFKLLTKVDLLHVPYNGSAAALPDLLAGRTDMMFDALPTSLPHIRDGKLRPLAITAAKRSSLLPDVPTMAEAGLPEYEAEGWYAVFAPAETPPAIVEQLNREVAQILQDPAVRQQLLAQGADVVGKDLAHFRKFVQSEHEKWSKVLSAANLSID